MFILKNERNSENDVKHPIHCVHLFGFMCFFLNNHLIYIQTTRQFDLYEQHKMFSNSLFDWQKLTNFLLSSMNIWCQRCEAATSIRTVILSQLNLSKYRCSRLATDSSVHSFNWIVWKKIQLTIYSIGKSIVSTT